MHRPTQVVFYSLVGVSIVQSKRTRICYFQHQFGEERPWRDSSKGKILYVDVGRSFRAVFLLLLHTEKASLYCHSHPTNRSYYSRKAGGFPPSMAVKKNKFMEEWNGKREITEKTFTVDFDGAPILVLYLMIIPYGIYTWTRSEFLSGGDRRYKEIV